MTYAIVRGWLSGMAAAFVELILAATLLLPGYSPSAQLGAISPSVFTITIIALLEEGLKCLSLRGISSETTPFFRNAIFKGLLVGTGFALFEFGLKILFQGDTSGTALVPGGISSGILHIASGGLLGAAWYFRIHKSSGGIFWIFFFGAMLLHIGYNILISPLLLSMLVS